MSLGEIFSDSLRYPFNDITKFLIIGILTFVVGLSSVVLSFGVDNTALIAVLTLIGLLVSFIVNGYGISVIRNGIAESDEIPDLDIQKNFFDGIKALIIAIIYFIIPILILLVVGFVTGALGASLNHVEASVVIIAVFAVILFILFGIFEIIAVARFANSDDWSDALSIGSVIDDVRAIGFLKIIGFLVIAIIVAIIVGIIGNLISYVPFIGIIISPIMVGGFMLLFYNHALGMLYARL